jgi:hypothetical protein
MSKSNKNAYWGAHPGGGDDCLVRRFEFITGYAIDGVRSMRTILVYLGDHAH